MIKKYKFAVNEEEKSRILSLHESRTKSQYLNLFEQDNGQIEELEETDGLKLDFATPPVAPPQVPGGQPTNITMRDETEDSEYNKGLTVQTLTPVELTKSPIQPKPAEAEKTATTQITFPKNDPTGYQTVIKKMTELGLDTKNLKSSIENVIKSLGYKI